LTYRQITARLGKRKISRLLICCLFLIFVAMLSLVQASQDFRLALPGWKFVFPRGHASHPEFKTEWWYYTGHLTSDQGEPFSYQLTFFRVGVRRPDPEARSAWSLHTLYFAHLALTDINGKKFIFYEKAGRGALGMSGAASDHYQVWIDDWQASLEGEVHHLQAAADKRMMEIAEKHVQAAIETASAVYRA